MSRGGVAMACEDLDPVRSKDEARRRGKVGGIKSGESRRRKRDMRETFSALLDMPLSPGKLSDAKTISGLTGKNVTVAQAIALQMTRKAMEGDVRAAQFVRDTSGQAPTTQVEVSAPASEAAAAFRDELSRAMGADSNAES